MAMGLTKIVSGGQTGVNRAARAAEFPCGGWTPADRMAEDVVIPEQDPVTPLPRAVYRQRTRQNVVDSDGTALIYFNSLKGGTRLTRNSVRLGEKAVCLGRCGAVVGRGSSQRGAGIYRRPLYWSVQRPSFGRESHVLGSTCSSPHAPFNFYSHSSLPYGQLTAESEYPEGSLGKYRRVPFCTVPPSVRCSSTFRSS